MTTYNKPILLSLASTRERVGGQWYSMTNNCNNEVVDLMATK